MDIPLLLRFLSLAPVVCILATSNVIPNLDGELPVAARQNDAYAPWYLSAGVQRRAGHPSSEEAAAPQAYHAGRHVSHTPSHSASSAVSHFPSAGALPDGSGKRIAAAAQEEYPKEFYPNEPDVEEPVGSPDYVNTQISNLERYMPLLARKLGLLGRNLTTMSPAERRTTPTPPRKFTRITKSRKFATKATTAQPEESYTPRENACLDGSCANSTAYPITRETTEPTNESDYRKETDSSPPTQTSSNPKFRNTKLVAVRRFMSTTSRPATTTDVTDSVVATLPTLPPPPVDEVDEKPEPQKSRPEKPDKEKWTGDKPWTHSAGPRGPCPPPSTEWSAFWMSEMLHSKSIASTELIDAIREALEKFKATLNRSDVHDDMRQVGTQLESTWNELRKGDWVERAFAELATLSDATNDDKAKTSEASFNETIRQRLENFKNRIVQEQSRLNSVIERHPTGSDSAASTARTGRGLHRIHLR